MSTARIVSVPEGLAFYTPYDAAMLAEFKATIPATDRRWDGAHKRWLVAVGQLPALERLCTRHGLNVVKQLSAGYDAPPTVQRILQVRYIGAPKMKNDGAILASGWADGDWRVVFPQDVLRAWFDGPTAGAPAEMSFYGLLGLRRDANEGEIKRAHRVMVKRWHPDINRDSDAPDMMKRINAAYAVLAEPKLRAKYDAGLILEASLSTANRPQVSTVHQWRPPLRCGWLLVEGQERLGRLVVAKILQWQDITDAAGRVLVTSWPMGADTFVESWV